MATQYEKRKAKTGTVKKKIADLKDQMDKIEFDKTAHDIIFNEEDRNYYEIVVEYSLKDNVARIKESKKIADSQPLAVFRSKEIFMKKLFNR